MRTHLLNPSDVSFGTAVITPRWMYVLAAATPGEYGDPVLVDETLAPLDQETIQAGDVVGIGIHTANALRGYHLGRLARERGAYVVFGGIHATLYPEEAHQLGGAHAVVKGDGDKIWGRVIAECCAGAPARTYEGGQVTGSDFVSARWDLIPRRRYMWASVQTVRGCPKHCSFCSVWRTDGQKPRQRAVNAVIREIVQLRRLGFRFIALADENFYPVTLRDIELAERQHASARAQQLQAARAERFELLQRMATLPPDMTFFTQITMEAAEDPAFLDAMHAARIKGALVGIESVTPGGLKDIYKEFNCIGEELIERLRTFRRHGVYVLGSFIFGLPNDQPSTFNASEEVAEQGELAFAQFVMLTPFPGTVDYKRWEKMMEIEPQSIAGVPITRRWLIPAEKRPKLYWPHPTMSAEEIRGRTQEVWDKFYSLRAIWKRSSFIHSKKGRLAFLLISKIYRQMYADTGIATDSARTSWSARWARWLARPCRLLFAGRPIAEQVRRPDEIVP